MARASKRAKTTATSTVTPDGAPSSMSAQPQPFIPFQTGPNMEHIPDDVLREILSYLPTFRDHHVLFGCCLTPPVIPSTLLVRSSTLRALSQTSRLLRSRCLGMAWQRIELCGAEHNNSFYRAIGEATRTGTRVLKACPHLLPLIQTVSVVLTRYQSAKIIPAFAACLATLPNLTTIQVIHAHSQMTTAIKNGFQGKQFPSVRMISLPSSAHEIIKSCPNLEEVTCTEGDGSTIIGSLVKGNCQELRVLKSIDAPLKRLVKVVPNLRHIAVSARVRADTVIPSTGFPLLDTIEFIDNFGSTLDAVSCTQQASEILKQNKSQAEKTVLLTKWTGTWGYGPYENDAENAFVTREAIKV